MIQISKMNKYWIMPVFALFLLRPLLIFAEEGDPFDNTILTVEDSIPITEPDATKIYQNISSQPEITVALDQPINTRYPITQYSMQGIIKSPNKTQMMFVAIDENVKFLLSLNDCLGLNCAFISDIDKRGRVTFEDENGVYRFQVGYSPFIVEDKTTDELQESLEVADEDQPLNGEAQVIEELSVYVEDLENDNTALDANNLILKSEIQVLSDSNIVLTNEIVSLNKKIQESSTSVQELQNTIASQEQTLNQQQENIKKLQEELQNSTLEATTSSDSADIENLQNTIASLNATLENKSKIINEAENQIAIQDKQIDSLKNNLDTLLIDFNKKLQTKEELIKNLEVQVLIQPTTDATSSQEQSESSTDDLVSTTTQSTENDSQTNDIASTEVESQPTTDATSSQEQSESSTDDLVSTIIESIENVSETKDITGDNLMVATEDVNIRKMPSPNSPILGVLLKDSTINVEDTVQGWYKIITKEGKEGYIYSPMLKEKN